MVRARLLIALALLVLVPRVEAASDFASMSISELGAGFLGNPNIQFVELRLDAAGQTNLTNTRLTAFDKDGVAALLLLTPQGIGDGTSGRNVLYATADFQSATGIAPDFVIPPGVLSPKGMICWGAPGTDSPPDPSSWDLAKPETYTDCVAYGGYDHGTRPASGTPSALTPEDGVQSLTRTQNTSASGSNATDFAFAAASPCNNTNQCAGLAPTPTSTPTSTPTPTPTVAASPIPTPGKAQIACRRTVIKAAAKYVDADTRARATCETARLKGKVAGPCPDGKAAVKIAAADAKRTKSILKACGTLTPADAGFGAACPGYTGACTDAIATVADVSACADCGARRAGEELAAAIYGAPADAALLKCQLGLGTAATGYYRAVSALLTKCEDDVARGKLVAPCPDAKTASTIAAKSAKLRSTICKACGGTDKLCDGSGDAAPATLGLTTCPARTVPGGAACGGLVIGELADVVACVECLANFESTCTTALVAHPTTLPATCDSSQ